jgi:hypothetical protein
MNIGHFPQLATYPLPMTKTINDLIHYPSPPRHVIIN